MRKPNTNCFDCNKPLYRRPCEMLIRKVFYCKKCQKLHMNDIAKIKNNNQYTNYIANWKAGLIDGMKGEYQISRHIIRYLFEKYNNKCSKCGWNEINQYTKKIPLETEHIDGDYRNNKEENLTLLCPNCHSLTSTYKGANKGNGRKERKKYA
jgi:hypothetical protein